jgi:hypothetical protein
MEGLLRKQTATLAVVSSKVTNGLFVKREELADEIGTAIQQHVVACEDQRMRKEIAEREDHRDRRALLGLLLRLFGTAASVVGGFAAANAMGLI